MFLNTAVWIKVMLAILVAFVVSIALTPFVKRLAVKVGAVDVPGEARRVHDHPIPAWAVWPFFWASSSRRSCLRTSRRRCAAFSSGRSSSSSPV